MKFEEYYKSVKPLIEKRLVEIVESEPEVVRKFTDYIVKSGGKRLRAVLTVLSSDVLGGDRDKALTYAAVIEFVHQASLVHDDIIDRDELRRGRPTFWRIVDKLVSFGNKMSLSFLNKILFGKPINLAVFTGDALLAIAVMLADKPEAKDALAATVKALLVGAAKEVMHPKEYVSKGLYYTIITGKTASLFATACYLGALCSNANENQKEALRKFGKHLGIMYQMVDDVVDEEAPVWLYHRLEDELREQYNLALNSLKPIPESEYKEALVDSVRYCLLALAKENKEVHERVLKFFENV